MTGWRYRAATRPRLTALMIIGLFVAFVSAPILFFGPEDMTGGTGLLDFETLTGGLQWQITLSIALLACVACLGWWRMTLLWAPLDRRGLRPLYLTMAYPLIGIVTFTYFLQNQGGPRSPFEVLGMVLALNFFVGLSEEVLFRGILFGALRHRHRLITAIVISSIAFGALHLVNAGIGQNAEHTLFQVINATALGALFCALTLAANNLWPAIGLHMVWNSYAMMGVASAEVMGETTTAAVDPLPLSPWSFLLPALILLIAIAILYGYSQYTRNRLRDVVPPPPTTLSNQNAQHSR